MAKKRRKRSKTGVLTPSLKKRREAGQLEVTPEQAAQDPKERGREGLTPLTPPLPGGRFDFQIPPEAAELLKTSSRQRFDNARENAPKKKKKSKKVKA